MFRAIFKNFLIIIVYLLFSSLVYAEKSLEGHWIDTLDNTIIIEFTDNKITVLSLNKGGKGITAIIEKIDNTKLRLINKEIDMSAVLTIDGKENVFSILNLLGKRKILTFKPAPQITISDIRGTWHSHKKTVNYESSIITKWKDSSYDFDALWINHDEKSFSKEVTKEIKYKIHHGFIFVQDSEEDGYSYYLVSHTKDSLSFAGLNPWTDHRKAQATHPKIPEGYIEEKNEY